MSLDVDTYQNKRRNIRCSYLVIDNFLTNPDETRKHILNDASFNVLGNYPGMRTRSYVTKEIKDLIQKFIKPFAGNITYFPMKNEENNYNGAFQYTTSRDRSWIHCDKYTNWAGILYLTPDAPASAGTGIFKHDSTGITTETEAILLNKQDKIDSESQDYTKWTKVDTIGNVYNRLVLFDSTQYHASLDYFGTNKHNGRLFQTFFFSTEL